MFLSLVTKLGHRTDHHITVLIAFAIMEFSANAKKFACVGAILFSGNENGIWVNWVAVSSKIYESATYGAKASNDSF